jgi:hypothetical protein
MDDWKDTRARIRQTEAHMTGVLDDLGLTELLTSIAGLTAVGPACASRAGGGLGGAAEHFSGGRQVQTPDHPRRQPARPEGPLALSSQLVLPSGGRPHEMRTAAQCRQPTR